MDFPGLIYNQGIKSNQKNYFIEFLNEHIKIIKQKDEKNKVEILEIEITKINTNNIQ